MRNRTLVPFLSLLLAGYATAQEVEPWHVDAPPCMHPELERIAFLEGDWEVVSRQRVDFTADRWEEARARATWTPILGGCVLQERWSGTLDGASLEWIQLVAYDHREDTWEQVMIDSAHGNVLKAEGHFDEDRLVFHVPHMRQGRLLIDRTTIEALSADRVDWKLETSLDGGRTWVTHWTMQYSRPLRSTGDHQDSRSPAETGDIPGRS